MALLIIPVIVSDITGLTILISFGGFFSVPAAFLAPAVTVGERRELWILPPFFFGLFFCL